MIACPTPGCETTAPDVGALAAHLYVDDRIRAGAALWAAREQAGIPYAPVEVYVPPARPALALVTRSPRSRPHHAQPGACKLCARIAPAKCKWHGGPSRHGVKRPGGYANPAACKLCARLTPGKCKRHGGPDRSTSYRGSGRALGSHKTAAHRIGLSLAEYETHLAEGKKWCFLCHGWHLLRVFGKDSRRHDGLASACTASKNARERALYATRGRASRGSADA